ncbi:mannose-6-phosphate isomerase [Winogradskyella sp. PC-19]|uniref:type I phosphomannose isomerase catalytic subunit n=1 Tax=unclassified Winogradskyella TaxID=2615021 RepID=UPI000B3C9E7E|nr:MULTISPECIES: type I phosphomannose isomerase catalytic subunit [unclassified Winogradskyella]ARV10195.1 mannose-6-phosphate isomerase [Winogradskyella sp. PC-19]RZN82097.1 MAG: mannose-6-phosphate isomerase [Winogradskyella sp.]
MQAYPIKFRPILKEKIWGGQKLNKLFRKASNSTNLGESWEISGVENNISVVANGIYKGKTLNDLITSYKSSFLGSENIKTYGENFPLLIKYLDANTNLSVQVHPDDKMANKYHNSFGKTEMWYVMDSEEDAEIIVGLKDENLDKNKLAEINKNNVSDIFNAVKVKKGDSYFIPAGKVHAIGAGVVVAEIQQTSDITYRVYDWDREDSNGQKRELHIDLAQQATKVFSSSGKVSHNTQNCTTANLVDCNYFTTNEFTVSESMVKNYKSLDSFVIYMCVEGRLKVTINGLSEFLAEGETILIPANCEEVILDSQSSKLLEVYID